MLFEQVRSQLERMPPLFGVDCQASSILACFDALCRESLDLDVRRRAPEFSRVNADGTPIQFALSLRRASPPALQFLSEAGRPGCPVEDRLTASYAALADIARACGVADEAERLLPTLRAFVPDHGGGAPGDPSGVFWLAVGFESGAAPSVTVYANGRSGTDATRWNRLEQFAALLGPDATWRGLSGRVRQRLSPLGVAVTIRSGEAPRGRLYLHAFGVCAGEYRALFLHPGRSEAREAAFDGFIRHMLRDDAPYPTGSAVFSLELPDAAPAGVKFELCAHCAFRHDQEAGERIGGWLTDAGFGAGLYLAALDVLADSTHLPDRSRPSLHAYAGIGVRGDEPYASIYLNPGAMLVSDGAYHRHPGDT